jgi:hypothetical protein
MIEEAETLIRESNGTIVDLSALSSRDLPAQHSRSSSGMTTEEACMLMRYAGLNAKTGFVMLTGHDPRSLELDVSANTAAQLIWYFTEGYNQAVSEDPLRSKKCTTYAIHLDEYDTDYIFYKSEHTGRWWVSPGGGSNTEIFPCTYRDYYCATNGQISDRIVSCTQASLKRSKHAL